MNSVPNRVNPASTQYRPRTVTSGTCVRRHRTNSPAMIASAPGLVQLHRSRRVEARLAQARVRTHGPLRPLPPRRELQSCDSKSPILTASLSAAGPSVQASGGSDDFPALWTPFTLAPAPCRATRNVTTHTSRRGSRRRSGPISRLMSS
jgi:hypothetical protein